MLRSGNFVCVSRDPMSQGADLVWGIVAANSAAGLRQGFVSIIPVTAPEREIRAMNGQEILRLIESVHSLEAFAIVDLFAPSCTSMRWTYSCLVKLFGAVETGRVPLHIEQILNPKQGAEFTPNSMSVQTSDLDPYQQRALQYVTSPDESVFRIVVGAAGTGKVQ